MRAAGDFFAGALVTVAIFLDVWREKGAFTDPASSCNLPLCRKAEAAAPMLHAAAMLLLLLLQLLSWWAVSATAVPVARMQRHRLMLRRPRQSTQQLAAAAGAILRVSFFDCPDRAQRAF